MLAFCGSILSHEQKVEPTIGKFIFGDKFSSSRAQLPSLIKAAGKIEKEIVKMMETQTAPPLRLNDHCKICEFQADCMAAANDKDDLSLLKRLSGKEIDALNKRGIFTVTQYSYTFRPRRAKKLMTQKIVKHHHSLNALAIRTQTVYIAGKPELPNAPTSVYLDVEGIPEESFYYLIGLIVDDGTNVIEHAFWANDKSEEKTIWWSFLEVMEQIPDYALFHYGSYETKFLKQMGAEYGGKDELLEKIRSRCFNVLSAIYGRIYFPSYSNDLKSIASFLGFKWSDSQAAGLTSILWRTQWEKSQDAALIQKLITYNNDDCEALRSVNAGLRSILADDNTTHITYPTKCTDELKAEKPLGIFKRNEFFFPELDKINKKAYWDYQRSKIYLRTSSAVKRVMVKKERTVRPTYRINREVIADRLKRCPKCNTRKPMKHNHHTRIVYDLKMFEGGIKRFVTRYSFTRFMCKKCKKTFYPPMERDFTSAQYGWNLVAWVIYQSIARLKSQNTIIDDLSEVFNYRLSPNIVAHFKERAARTYNCLYESLLSKILSGALIHIDETKISVKGANNYVWAMSNMENVICLYNSSREADMIKDKLSNFKGILVSDFYTAYDSISCPQQKCLIHLIRDINDDILKNPFDDEMKEIGKDFTMTLSPIIETIDKYGLKRRNLHKHKNRVLAFFNKVQQKEYASALAKNFQRRFSKYNGKLFTFLDHDGIPWNNNNAEHAIKRFVQLRKAIGGSSTAKGMQEYLVLLSICETLRLRNASFLRFLLSGATDIDEYLKPQSKKAA